MARMASANANANGLIRRMRNAILYLSAVVFIVTIWAVFGLQDPAAAVALRSRSDDAVQTDGTVRAILAKGDRIYLGGEFNRVNGQPRFGLAAINANTGALTGWNPRADGRVLALAVSPDGSRIYAGGTFTRVNGAARAGLVAIHATGPKTGETVASWGARAQQGPVWSLESSGGVVYVGGQFDVVNGDRRAGLAAVDGDTGALDARWKPNVQNSSGNVRTLAMSPDKNRIYAGGNFSRIDGKRRPNLAALDADTGAVKPWNPKPRVRNNYEVFDLAVTGDRVHVAGGGRDPDGTAESFDARTGDSVWRYWSSGDFQAVTLLDNKLYFGGHFIRLFEGPGNNSPVIARRNKFMAVNADTGALDARWRPTADVGVWAMVDSNDPARPRVYTGGAFTRVTDEPQRGFAQFSAR